MCKARFFLEKDVEAMNLSSLEEEEPLEDSRGNEKGEIGFEWDKDLFVEKRLFIESRSGRIF